MQVKVKLKIKKRMITLKIKIIFNWFNLDGIKLHAIKEIILKSNYLN